MNRVRVSQPGKGNAVKSNDWTLYRGASDGLHFLQNLTTDDGFPSRIAAKHPTHMTNLGCRSGCDTLRSHCVCAP